MKGLILYESGKKDEGRTICNAGLKEAFSSFFAWDVTSRIRDMDGLPHEAIVCMKNALRNAGESDNASDMRVKLSLAQFNAQDYVGFFETRTQILTAKPDEARSWAPCAIAAHFMGDIPTALTVMDRFIEITRANLPPHELSELLFYKSMLLFDAKDYTAALAHLQKEEVNFVEKRRWREEVVRAYLHMGRETDAVPLLLQLLDLNSEDAGYLANYIQAKGAVSVEQRVALFDELQQRYPRSAAAKRGPLDVLPASDPRFLSAFTSYYRALVEKGAPSCFESVISLYRDADKVKAIEGQINADLDSLRKNGTFSGSSEKASATALLWQLYFVAQHYDRLSQWSHAITLLDEALAHTPTLIDLYIVKGRVAKHMGDLDAAFVLTDRARELDTADRWLNSHCVRYALEADKPVEADLRLGLFAKAEDGMNNVFEMQNQRYMLALAQSHLRTGKPAAALKILAHLISVYDAFVTDHQELLRYSMTAGTVGPWYEMGRHLRTARSNPNFLQAARLIIETYLGLLESGKKAPQPAPANKSTRSILFIKGDADPLGEILYATDPLAQAYKYAQLLVRGAPAALETFVLAGRVGVARGKVVQALAFLGQAVGVPGGENHPDVWSLALRILVLAPSTRVGPELVKRSSVQLLHSCTTPEALMAAWKVHPAAVGRVAHAEAIVMSQLNVLKTAPAALPFDLVVSPADLHVCLRFVAWLKATPEVAQLASPFALVCVKVFPDCVAFGGTPNPRLAISDASTNQANKEEAKD